MAEPREPQLLNSRTGVLQQPNHLIVLPSSGPEGTVFQAARVGAIISIVLLVFALTARGPYGFYTFLRIAVCASAVCLAVQAYQLRKAPLAWILGGIAVLFNPLIPIYMQRGQWRWFDFLALLIFVISLGVFRHRPETASHSS
jgi:hypothetical protein